MVLLKRIFMGIAGLVVALIVIAGIAIFTIDASQLKPVIQKQLRAQGIDATFAGEFSWQLFPHFGITLGDVTLNPAGDSEPDNTLAKVGMASVSVEVMPLFKRQIKVDGVDLNDTQINYVVAQDGSTNWDPVLASGEDSQSPPEEEEKSSGGGVPEINVKRLAIDNFNLLYKDMATDTSTELTQLSFSSETVNFDGKLFPAKLAFTVALPDLPTFKAAFDTQLALQLDDGVFKLTPFTATLTQPENSVTPLSLNGNLTIATQPELDIQGDLAMGATSLRDWLDSLSDVPLETAADYPLTEVALQTAFSLADNTFTLRDTKATLDKTPISGQLTYNLPNEAGRSSLSTRWNIGKINLDDYLPPTAEEEAEPETVETEPTPLPLEMLRSLDADVDVAIEQATIAKMPLSNIQLQLNGKNGDYRLKTLSSALFEKGRANLKGDFLASKPEPTLQLSGNIKAIDVGKILETLAETDILGGVTDGAFNVKSFGSTDKALTDNLLVNADIEAQSLLLNPVNIEQQYCRAIALVAQKEMPAVDWQSFTRLEPVKASVTYAKDLVTLGAFNAEIQDLLAKASGQFNVEAGTFKFPIEISLADFASGTEGCGVIPEKLRTLKIPLLCEGSLETIGAKTCLPNTQLIKDALKAKVESKVEREVEKQREKAKQEIKEESQKAIDKLKESEKAKKLEDKLKGALKGFGKN